MPEFPEAEQTPSTLEQRSVLDLVDTERRPNVNDPFFQRYLLDPERLYSEILSETEGDQEVDTDRLAEVLNHYRETAQEYYEERSIVRPRIVREERDQPNVQTGFQGMSVFTDAMNHNIQEEGSDNRQMALAGCMGFYTRSIQEHYEASIERCSRRGIVQGKVHPRLIATFNFLAAAWSTRSHYAGLFAQRAIGQNYTDLNADLGAYVPKYVDRVEQATSPIVRRMEGQKLPVAGTERDPSIARLVDTLPVLEIKQLRAIARDRRLEPLISEDGNILITGLYRHYMVAESIVEGRDEVSQRGIDTSLPAPLLGARRVVAAHNLLQTHYRSVEGRSLHEYLYDTVPLDFEGTFPDDVIAALDSLRERPGDPARQEIVCGRLSAHAQAVLDDRYAELVGTKEPPVRTAHEERAANFAKGLVSATFPEHLLADGGERSRVSEEVRTLRAQIRKYGWETLAIPGEVYHVEDNPHLASRGIDSMALQFGPYFNSQLRGGYVVTLRIRGGETQIHLYVTDLSDFCLLIPRGENYQRVQLPISHADRDYITRYVLQHLEPIKRGDVPTYTEAEPRAGGSVGGAEVERRVRKRPYHIQARKPGENRSFYKPGTAPYIGFIKKIGAEERLHPDDLWEQAIVLLERLEARHPDVWNLHTRRESGDITEIDSLIIRLVIARELSYEQVMDFERFAQDRYTTSAPHDADCIVRAQIHIYELDKLAKRPPNRVRMASSFEG